MNYRSKILNRLQVEFRKEERKPAIYSTLILAFLLFLVLIFLIPSIDIISKLKVRNDSLKSTEAELQAIYKSYKTAGEYYNNILDKVSLFEQNIPIDTDPYYFVKRVNEVGIKNRVSLKTLKLISKSSGIESYEISVSGNYVDIQGFFNELKRDTRYFSTEYINLKPISGLSGSQQLNLTAKIYIFYKL